MKPLFGVALAVSIAGLTAASSAPLPTQAPDTPAAVSMLHAAEDQRRAYLAAAEIWSDRAMPSPAAIRQGPPGRHPMGAQAPPADAAFPCTYLKGGTGGSGRTEKFTCRTADGRTLRVKYYDGNPRSGNREVFAEVAATRLFWALGFNADAMFPITVQCLDCPLNPMTGKGARATRRYVGVLEAFYEGTVIGSGTDLDEGWAYADVAAAIAALPPGAVRSRQEMHFDALTLLSSFVQHGDRKPSQQRLSCRGPLDFAAGDVHPLDGDEGSHLPALFERAGARACATPVLTVQDLGATFGGAGQFTPMASKAHLRSWSRMPVFAPAPLRPTPPGAVAPCRGALVMAMSAGPGAGGDLVVREPGRRFLFERLSGLTRDHLAALFDTARLLELDEPHQWTNPDTGAMLTGIDAWVGAFEYKVAQIGRTTCGA